MVSTAGTVVDITAVSHGLDSAVVLARPYETVAALPPQPCPLLGSAGVCCIWVLESLCATSAEGEVTWVGRSGSMRCCVEDEGWPFGAALRGEAPNHPLLR